MYESHSAHLRHQQSVRLGLPKIKRIRDYLGKEKETPLDKTWTPKAILVALGDYFCNFLEAVFRVLRISAGRRARPWWAVTRQGYLKGDGNHDAQPWRLRKYWPHNM